MKGKIYDQQNEEKSKNSQLSPSITETDATLIGMLHENKLFENDSDDHVYYRFAALIQRTLRVPYAAILLDDGHRKLFESKIGSFSETKITILGTFCDFTVLSEGPEVKIVYEALSDERFKDNPNVIGPPFFRFYAGTALIVDGLRVGSLCVFDTKLRPDFIEDEIIILFDFGSTVSSLIKTQREMQLNLQAKYIESLKLEQKKFASNLVMEKNKIIVDLMHQVRTPLMGIQLSVSMIESEQQAISELVQTNPNVDTVHKNKIGSTIQELKSATSQLDNYITTNLKSDANMIIDNSLNRILNRNTSFSHDRLSNTINSKTIPCNFNEFLCSIRHKCSVTIKTTEIEWTVNPGLTARSLETHPDALQTILCSVLSNASTLWSQATVTFEVSERCGCHTTTEDLQAIIPLNQSRSQDSWSGFISVTVRLYERLPFLLSCSSSNKNSSTEMDIKQVEAILGEIGGCYRVFNFDSNSFSSTLPFICDEKDTTSVLFVKEQLLEFFIPSVFFEDDLGGFERGFGPTDMSMLTYLEGSSSSRRVAAKAPLYRMRTMSLSEESHCSCSSVSEVIERISQNSGKCSHTSQTYCTNDNNRIRPLLSRRAFLNSDSDSSSSPDHVRKLSSASSVNGRPLRILLVDDSAIIYKVMKKWLEAEGCEVTIAENGKIALSYLKIHQYDVTLMDFIMPVMLGKVAMRYFQDWQLENPHLHLNQEMLLIGMSANASPHDQKEAFQYGMHYFATKPTELTFLKTVLEAKRRYRYLQQTIQCIDFMTDSTSLTVIKGTIWKEKDRGRNPCLSTRSAATATGTATTTTAIIRKMSTECGIRKSSVVLKLEQSILEDTSYRTQLHARESGGSNTDEMVSNSPIAPRQGCLARLRKCMYSFWCRGRSSSQGGAEQQRHHRFSKKILPAQVIN